MFFNKKACFTFSKQNHKFKNQWAQTSSKMAIHGGEAGYCQTMSWRMFCDWTGTIICVIVQIKQTQRNKESQLGADAVPWLLIWFCHSQLPLYWAHLFLDLKMYYHSVSGWSSRQRKSNHLRCPLPTPFRKRVGLIPRIDLWGPELLSRQ